MNLNEWAIKWNIPFAAVEDLRREFGTLEGVNDFNPNDTYISTPLPKSEAAVQVEIRLEASRLGMRLFRNNVGAGYTEDGDFIRWGLANDSAQMNKVIKSSDLIGIRPVTIGPEHIGRVIGQFVAREVKPSGWTFAATEHENAQLKFLELIASLGGDAAFANREGTL